MATGRFFKLAFVGFGSSTYAIQGAELYDVSGGVDLAHSSGSATSNTGTPANAFDHNAGTAWNADGLSYLQVDFGTSVSIDEVIVREDTANPFAFVTILASDDSVLWRVVAAATAPAGAATTFNTTSELVHPQMGVVGRQECPGVRFSLTPGHLLIGRQNMPNLGFKGNGVIEGEVDVLNVPLNTPLSRKVRVHLVSNGMLLREGWSDPITGAYRFDGLPLLPCYVMTFDWTLNYNAVVKDGIMPVLQ